MHKYPVIATLCDGLSSGTDCMASQLLNDRYCAATEDTYDAAPADLAGAVWECENFNVPIVPIQHCQLSIRAFGT